MNNQQIALLLETIGFFVTAILVGLIKWSVVKPKADRVKSFIVESRTRLLKLYEPLAWRLSHFATESGKIPPKMEAWQSPIFIIRYTIHTILVAPLVLILLSLLLLPLYAVLFFSRHNAITNTLIVLGIAMVFAGLILELIINW